MSGRNTVSGLGCAHLDTYIGSKTLLLSPPSVGPLLAATSGMDPVRAVISDIGVDAPGGVEEKERLHMLTKNDDGPKRRCLLASDFDQTLSFNDSGAVLADILNIPNFQGRIESLAAVSLVQQGGELTYLLRHDPEFRRVRRDDLIAVGKRVRLKANIALLAKLVRHGIPGFEFEFYVISAAPEEVIQSALEGLVPPENIFGTQLDYDAAGEISGIRRVPAGFGKVAVLDALQAHLQVPHDRVVYVGDGSSDIHVMLHTNHRHGLTIAVSEAKRISQIAKRTVLSEDVLSLLVPILEEIAHYDPDGIRLLLQSHGVVIQEWNKGRTDWVSICPVSEETAVAPVAAAKEEAA